LAGSAAAVAGLVMFGAALLVVSAVMNSAQIGLLADALDAGPVGNTVLALGGGAVVPNATVWAASFALGPGFVVGTETIVAPAGVELGMVPALPALGALPAGLPGTVIWVVLAGPVAAGVIAGVLVHRRLEPHEEPMSIVVLAAGGAGAAAAIGMSVLALFSGGAVGAARLAEVGPVPWEVAAMTFVAVGVPCMITAWLLAWRSSAAEE
jgi:hypothetical protein